MMRLRAWMTGAALLAAATLIWIAGSRAAAGDDEKAHPKKVLEMAAKMKTDKDEGMKMAAAFAKKLDTLEHVMHSFKPRKKGGLGVGPKPEEITPDGIELYIIQTQRDGITATALAKQAKALEDLAYHSAAIAEVARNFDSDELFKGAKKGKKKDWQDLAARSRDASLKLAAAAQAKGAGEIKSAAKVLNDVCNACHSIFRE
jgi:hypothetical protein